MAADEVKETPVVEEAEVVETPVVEEAVEKEVKEVKEAPKKLVKINLQDQFQTNGIVYGPGVVEVDEEMAEDLRRRQDEHTEYKLSLHRSKAINTDMGEIAA